MPKRPPRPRLSAQELQRKHWLKALQIARLLFAEEGYHTAYLNEIEAFLCQQPVPIPETSHALDEDTTGAEHLREPALPYQHAPEPPAPAAGQYRVAHYPHSRFWAVYDRERLIAVTVYRRGAREVVGRLEMHERAIAALKRQLGQLPSLG